MTMTVEEIIEDIVEYYRTNPRGLMYCDKSSEYLGCSYKGCAVGFACGFNVNHWDDGAKNMSPNIYTVYDNYSTENGVEGTHKFWDHFLPQYRYCRLNFWSEIQMLHDEREHWIPNDEGGQDLSLVGKAVVNSILEAFGE